MKRAGVMLTGCGYLDGAEIQEAVLTVHKEVAAGIRACVKDVLALS